MKERYIFGQHWIVPVVLVSMVACSGAPVQLGQVADEKYDVLRPREISARACGFQLLLLIPIRTNDRAARAYRALKLQAGSDYIADVKVKEEWTYAFVGTIYCTTLEATAYSKVEM